jgi:hypothetical protein
VILAKELKSGLHPVNGQDLSAKLDRAHMHVDRTPPNSLVDLGMLPIQDIPNSHSRSGKS